jgi:glycosyltransferase involved in cell wall biosynthesis
MSDKPMLLENIAVSVIIPAYNEEKTIEEIMLRTNKTMETLGVPYELLVVDDGSTDNTRLLAERHKATILTSQTNRGKGYALKTGFQKAIGNVIVTIDADGSHQPEEIPKLLKPMMLSGVDIVSGSRFLGRQETSPTKRLNTLGNHFFNFLILLLTKKRITDSQTGFRAVRKRVLDEIEVVSNGYQIETELTIKTLRNGFSVQEEAITCVKRRAGNSQINVLSDGIRILMTILRTYFASAHRDFANTRVQNREPR